MCQFFEHVLQRIRHEQTRLLRIRILAEQQAQMRLISKNDERKSKHEDAASASHSWQRAEQLWTVQVCAFIGSFGCYHKLLR